MDHSNGTTVEKAYSVEARFNYPEPKKILGQIYGKEWKRVIFKKAQFGIPVPTRLGFTPFVNDQLTYTTAQALRWWFICSANAEEDGQLEYEGLGCLCLETRLVEHHIKCVYELTEEKREYMEVLTGRGTLVKDEPTSEK